MSKTVFKEFYLVHSSILCLISYVGNCGDSLQKNSNSNKTRPYAQSCQGRWSFFLDLELGQAVFMLKICIPWNAADLTQYLSYISAKKNFVFFLFFVSFFLLFARAVRHLLPTSPLFLLLWKACSHRLCFKKNLLFSSFDLPCHRNKRAVSVKV